MKDIALPVASIGKEILDCDGDHVADCVSNEVAAQIVHLLNSTIKNPDAWRDM